MRGVLSLLFLVSILYAKCPTGWIQTTSGTYCGKVNVESNVTRFLGVEYAYAKRWKPAQPLQEQQKHKLAFEYGPQCPQYSSSHPDLKISEGCLSLNIWVPMQSMPKKTFPVMVFIHGGAFFMGSSSFYVGSDYNRTYQYNGENIAKEESVVFVSLNYRLGALGFLHVKGEQSGNFGIFDQLEALKWVKENIDKFHGDAENIMLVGQSAGAISVLLHATAEQSKGLFHKVVAMSPYMGVPLKSDTAAKEDATRFFNKLKQKCINYLTSDWEECRAQLSTYDILSAQSVLMFDTLVDTLFEVKLNNLFAFAPYIDKKYIKKNLLFQKPHEGLKLLLGNTANESNFFLGSSLLQSAFKHEPVRMTLDKKLLGKELLEKTLRYSRYRFEEENLSAQYHIDDDYVFTCATQKFAALHAKQSDISLYFNRFVPSFNYMATKSMRMKDCNPPAVCHASDLPYFFGEFMTMKKAVTPTAEDIAFSKAFMHFIAAFSKGEIAVQSYSHENDNWLEVNATSPYFYERQGFSKPFYCDVLWSDYYNKVD